MTLGEWERLGPTECPSLAGLRIGPDPGLRRLIDVLSETRRLRVVGLAGGLEIQSTSFVGRVDFGEFSITVHPKISGTPLLSLMRYAYGLRQLDLEGKSAYASAPRNFQDLLVQQLQSEVAELLSRGLHREYERRQADLTCLSGRVDLNRFARTFGTRSDSRVPCIHYPRDQNTALNQALLAGVLFAAAMTTDADCRGQLRHLARILDQTITPRALDASVLEAAQQRLDRRTSAYGSALRILELLLAGEGVSLDQEPESIRVPGFLFDMNRFFQALVSRFLRENLADEVVDEHRIPGLFRYDPTRNPKGRISPVQRPDFVIRRGRRMLAILDAKYRDLWTKPLPQNMLYQVALYALAPGGGLRKAVIIYPTMSRAATEQAVFVRDPSGWASEAEVVLRPLNLLDFEGLLSDANRDGDVRRRELATQLVQGPVPVVH